MNKSILKTIAAALFLSAASFQANAFILDFTITHGVVCPITESCSYAYYDPAGSFQADVQTTDGSMVFSSPIDFTFNSGTQGFSMTADGGSLAAAAGNPAVTDGVIPNGNWDGILNYTTSLGGTGNFILDSSISFNTFFIDNVDNTFTLSVMDPFGANQPGNDGIGASFIISGTIALGSITEPEPPSTVPAPASLVLLALGLAGIGFGRRKKH